ncbi:protein lifeguard 4 [Diachasma alloeum]|uniref:protein lifeguard 4 n=1 Tax=Diachasma alloeum TaxID=454923 RepID=UPI0007384293|nr:protein lifeguard 4 [Diachasma alloeum]XP_015114902.1 protein lifeguard 4 [Diachasma alloeum]XP_028982079.1 protein lifeguard 4 [Diachasma alloeum]
MTSAPLLLSEEDVESGGKSDDSTSIQNDFAYRNNVYNAHIKIRMAFLRKVYGLISMQLLLTVAIAVVFVVCQPVQYFVHEKPWVIGIPSIASMVILIALHCKRKDHPANLILLCIFTVLQAFSIGSIVTFFDANVVLEAIFITMAIVIGLTVYTFQSKRDFSFLGFGLFAGLFALLVGGLVQIYVQSSLMEIAMGIAGAVLFALFIIYDTHNLMNNLSPEEYILAAINIYLDILNLFLYILRALAARR